MDVIVGVDPHKQSVTFEAIDEQGHKVAMGRFGTATSRPARRLSFLARP